MILRYDCEFRIKQRIISMVLIDVHANITSFWYLGYLKQIGITRRNLIYFWLHQYKYKLFSSKYTIIYSKILVQYLYQSQTITLFVQILVNAHVEMQ